VEDVVGADDIAFIGLRSFEADELLWFSEHPNTYVRTAHDVLVTSSPGEIAQKLCEKFKDYDSVYVTLDIDVLDPSVAPGTGTPEAGGLAVRNLYAIFEQIFAVLPISVLDVVEVSPPLDTAGNNTSWTALKIIYEVLGWLSRTT
jgi:agmatinase